jgi:hypothetical protein
MPGPTKPTISFACDRCSKVTEQITGQQGSGLCDSHRLGQVARLVNVEAAQHCQMVAEQLQRHDIDDWLQAVRHLWHLRQSRGTAPECLDARLLTYAEHCCLAAQHLHSHGHCNRTYNDEVAAHRTSIMRHLSLRSCALGLSPPLHITISCAPRACSCAMIDCILDHIPSLVATCRAAESRR